MPQQELLNKVIEVLDRLGIESMLTGSWASSSHGAPRATHDIDLVVELDLAQLELLANEFLPPDYYLSPSAMRDAVRSKRMFNLLSISTGDKVDFWQLTDSPFDRSRFARRSRSKVGDVSLFVASAEDTILAKLNWVKEYGASEKHLVDAIRVYEVLASTLDHEYLERWAVELQVDGIYQQLLAAAKVEPSSGDDASSVPF